MTETKKSLEVTADGLCWCGSGKPYEECHKAIDDEIKLHQLAGEEVPTRDMIKTPAQIAGIRKACDLNTAVLDEVSKYIRKGMTTEEIDQIVYQFTVKHGGTPAPLGFCGFPKSVCTSVNDQVCHGIPDRQVILRNGDIVNVDASTIVDGYYGDASRMFEIGHVDKRAKDLVAITRECLKRGVEAAKPWGHLGDVGAACSAFAHKHHYSVVEEFGGHGVGVEFHEDPFVAHVGKKGTGMLLVPGMIFTIEPMLNEGRKDVFIDSANDWTVYTEDGSLSAQWEHTILITEDGAEILTY
ncbi:MAG: Methionine aminopeptidase [Succiniclasticum sp.]